MLLRDLAREAHAIALGDADVSGKLDQPVGEQEIGQGVYLLMLLHQRRHQALRADADDARAEHAVGFDQLGEKGKRERHDGGGSEREGRGGALGALRQHALLQELELAENLAMHDALEAEQALAGGRLQFDLDQRIDVEPFCMGARAEQEIDGFSQVAGAEHRLAGSKRAQAEPRPLEKRERGVARPAHQC